MTVALVGPTPADRSRWAVRPPDFVRALVRAHRLCWCAGQPPVESTYWRARKVNERCCRNAILEPRASLINPQPEAHRRERMKASRWPLAAQQPSAAPKRCRACCRRKPVHSLLLLRPQALQLSPGARPSQILWKRARPSASPPRALRCALARLLLQAGDESAQR
jgi:hypothetical protein